MTHRVVCFERELKELLVKYKAEITVREISHYWETYVDGIDIEFEPVYDQSGNVIAVGECLKLPYTVSGEE